MLKLKTVLAGAVLAVAGSAHANIIVSEVAAWGSGNSPYAADWFELTNTGGSAVNIGGWKMDDNSNSFASSVALTGITSIAPGESVIFIENTGLTAGQTTTLDAQFASTWFGSNVPVGLQIGNYGGSQVGLSTSTDAVNIYNGSGVLQANVSFNASDASSPFQTFDNAQGLNNGAISQLSLVGTSGAFVAASDAAEVGSPGRISSVPLPAAGWLLLSGLGALGASARRRRMSLKMP